MSFDGQSSLREFAGSTGDGIRDYLTGLYGRLRNTLEDVGLDLDWWGEGVYDAEPDDDVWVYQYVVAYSGGRMKQKYDFGDPRGKRPARDGSPSPEVQFKTGIYVVGEPTPELEDRFVEVDNPRLRTLFNTREYAGYMEGFGFDQKKTYTQREVVSAREVDQKGVDLGVPWFEVEAYDEDGSLEGFADGYYNPFTTETRSDTIVKGEEVPEQEVWRVQTGLNEARGAGGQWEIGPDADTPARERAKAAGTRSKSVYVGPFEVGTVTARGTTWLRREYDSGGKYADKSTITAQSGIPPQALQKGAKLYKYRETADAIYLSTTKPTTGFKPTEASDVSPEQVGVEVETAEVTDILLDEDEPTQWTVETDEDDGRLLGLYQPPVVRDIDRGTDFV